MRETTKRELQMFVQITLATHFKTSTNLDYTFKDSGLDSLDAVELIIAINSFLGEDVVDPLEVNADHTLMTCIDTIYVQYSKNFEAYKDSIHPRHFVQVSIPTSF